MTTHSLLFDDIEDDDVVLEFYFACVLSILPGVGCPWSYRVYRAIDL